MMINSKVLRTGILSLAVAAVGASAVAFRPPAHYFADSSPAAGAIEITARDVTASNEKVAMAHGALASMWRSNFRSIGAQFAVPGLARYRGRPIASGCGVMRPNNA